MLSFFDPLLLGHHITKIDKPCGQSRQTNADALVSICIPVYNGEKTIRETVLSATRQTYPNKEIIVVDNCSTDKTIEILESLQCHNLSVYRNNENLGMVGNWNKCMEHSRGEYAIILCADDIIEDDCIEKKVQMMAEDESIVFVFGASEVINDQEVLLKRRFSPYSCIVDGTALALKSYHTKNIFGEPSNVLFRKSTFNEVGKFDDRMCYCVDLDMWFRMACRGKVGFVSDVLMQYRVSGENQTSSLAFQQFLYDDTLLIKNLRKEPLLHINMFDDLLHRVAYAVRNILRHLFMRIRA